MPVYFADTSALLKLYLPEPGSTWLLSLDRARFSVSSLAPLEVRSALARRQRGGSLLPGDADKLWKAFGEDLRGWGVIELDLSLLASALSLLGSEATRVPLRTLDAIQLASGQEAERRARQAGAGPIVLLTADARLEAAAAQVGLTVENPNRHA